MQEFVEKLKASLKKCLEVKEQYLLECDFKNAARFRDIAGVIKKILNESESEIITNQAP